MKMKTNALEIKIDAYLRLAEMCGVGDERRKLRYMDKVEDTLLELDIACVKESYEKEVERIKASHTYQEGD